MNSRPKLTGGIPITGEIAIVSYFIFLYFCAFVFLFEIIERKKKKNRQRFAIWKNKYMSDYTRKRKFSIYVLELGILKSTFV